MAYIGRSPQAGNYSKLDSIAASFNGSLTTFNLTVAGAAFTASQATQLIISVAGVLQEPETAYTVSGSQITFTSAPAFGASFFGVALGDTLDIGVPSNGSVTTAKLQDNAVTTAKIADTNVTTAKIADANVTTAKIADANITGAKLNIASVATSNGVFTHNNNTFTKSQKGEIDNLGVRNGAAGNTVTLTLTDSNHFSFTANANITMANPTLSGVVGQGGSIIVTANGSYTTSWGSYWRFKTGTAPTMSTVAGKQDRIDYQVISSNTIHATASIDMLGTS